MHRAFRRCEKRKGSQALREEVQGPLGGAFQTEEGLALRDELTDAEHAATETRHKPTAMTREKDFLNQFEQSDNDK